MNVAPNSKFAHTPHTQGLIIPPPTPLFARSPYPPHALEITSHRVHFIRGLPHAPEPEIDTINTKTPSRLVRKQRTAAVCTAPECFNAVLATPTTYLSTSPRRRKKRKYITNSQHHIPPPILIFPQRVARQEHITLLSAAAVIPPLIIPPAVEY